MADNADLDGANGISNKSDMVHVAAYCNQRGGYGEKYISGTHRINDDFDEHGNMMWAYFLVVGATAVVAVGDDEP